MTEKEYTKVVNRKCQDCGKRVSILCNESCQVVSIRCPDCFQTFLISTIEIEQLRSYLKKNGWEELSCEREEAIKVRLEGTEQALTSIAIYEDKTFDEVLSEVLNSVFAEDKK